MDILKHQVFGNTLDKWVKKSKMNKVFLHFFRNNFGAAHCKIINIDNK